MKFYDFKVKTVDGKDLSLAEFKGKVLLVVNVASRCGFTPQYTGLESLYQKYRDQGFSVLGFPCNQFGAQEPGNEAEIKNFCSTQYNVTFPLFSKVEVNGAQTHPLYTFLKSEAKGLLGSEMIKWNFTKFLIDGEGRVVQRFAPNVEPSAIEPEIKKLFKTS